MLDRRLRPDLFIDVLVDSSNDLVKRGRALKDEPKLTLQNYSPLEAELSRTYYEEFKELWEDNENEKS